MASFLRQPGHAQRYTTIKIEWVDHHNPDLILFDAQGGELRRVDLTLFSSTDAMHRLVKALGFAERCVDDEDECPRWARQAECVSNPSFMLSHCRKSCNECAQPSAPPVHNEASTACSDRAPRRDCEYWSTFGDCEDNPHFMNQNCALSCDVCDVHGKSKDEL